MQAHIAVLIRAAQPHGNKISASSTGLHAAPLAVLSVHVIVCVLEVPAQLEQAARRNAVEARAALGQPALVDQRREHLLGLPHRETCRRGRALRLGRRGGAAAAALPRRLAQAQRVGGAHGKHLARGRVVGVEHGVQQPLDVGERVGRVRRRQLRWRVRHRVHHRVHCLLLRARGCGLWEG